MMDCLTRFPSRRFSAILKILIRADILDADEHEASPSLTPHIVGRLSRIFQCIVEYSLEIRARVYHYISEQHRPDRFITS